MKKKKKKKKKKKNEKKIKKEGWKNTGLRRKGRTV